MEGKVTFHTPNGDVVWVNHIMNQGIQKMMRIIADNTETNIILNGISLGESAATPDDRTLTALVDEHADGIQATGSFSVNSSFPYDLELSTTIAADKYLPRDYVAKEIGIWFDSFLFARAVDSVGVTLGAGAIPVTYDLVVV